jgi:pimeloyl-CoA dehydrogenase small subunit
MNFDFSDEQRLLKDSIERLLAKRYGFEARRSYIAAEGGFSPDIWQEFADLGLLALPFSEEEGGIGGGAEEIMIAMQAMGRVLTVEPFLSAVVIAASILRNGANTRQRADLVPQIADGTLRLAFAHCEKAAGYRLAHVDTIARTQGTGFVLDGHKTLVLHGGSAQKFIVSARLAGEVEDEAGIGLFLVEASLPGITRHDYSTQDGMRAAEITLSGVILEADALLGNNHDALPVIKQAVDEAIAALTAEAVGAMEAALEITVEYLKTRKQFGRAIGDFQALQHRASEMVVELEQARSMAMYATMMSRNLDASERARTVSAAKIQISKSAKAIGQACVQLHGGVGMTMEYQIGHYFKRLTMIEKAFGDTDWHLDQLSKAGGLEI